MRSCIAAWVDDRRTAAAGQAEPCFPCRGAPDARRTGRPARSVPFVAHCESGPTVDDDEFRRLRAPARVRPSRRRRRRGPRRGVPGEPIPARSAHRPRGLWGAETRLGRWRRGFSCLSPELSAATTSCNSAPSQTERPDHQERRYVRRAEKPPPAVRPPARGSWLTTSK